MNEKNLPDDINSKTLDELTQEAKKLINKLEKDENLQNSILSYQELVKLNKIIGYTSYIKKNDIYVFKIIDLKSQHKKRGKRCDQSGKSDIIKLFNSALDSNEYNNENTKNLTSLELCCLQELIFRYYTQIKKNENIWFLDSHDSFLLELNDWKVSV